MNDIRSIDPPVMNGEVSGWNRSVKSVALLYRWNLIEGYQEAFRMLARHQNWEAQAAGGRGNALLRSLKLQLPLVDGPRIWACFHIGPYGLLARALIRQGHGVAILLKDAVFDEQYPQYIQRFQEDFGRPPTARELQFVRSGDSRALFRLKKLAGEGLHIICYIDGREGAYDEKGWTNIQLHGSIYDVRAGAAVLAHWTKIPLLPLVLTFSGCDQVQVYAGDEVPVNQSSDYQPAMNRCYQLLEALSPEELIQWERLPDLYQLTERRTEPPEEKEALWVPIGGKRRNILFDLDSGCAIVVSKGEFRPLLAHLKRLYEQANKALFLKNN